MIRFLTVLFVMFFAAVSASAQIKIEQVTSEGGIQAWLVNESAIPFVAIQIAFQGGTALDAEGKTGATNFMVGLLEEGTGNMDATAFRQASESLAAKFGFSANRDSVRISVQVLKSNMNVALALLRKAIMDPAFNETAISRVRAQIISGLESDLKDPQTIASNKLNAIAFAGHPYALPSNGTLDTVEALTRSDLIDAHRAVLTKDHLVLSVVGDVTAAELAPMLDTVFGGLPEKGAKLPQKIVFGASKGTTVVDFPSPQSQAIWAQPIDVDPDHPDFIPLFVMNHILGGGGFGSRLTDEVREKRGLTYGIYSYIAWLGATEYLGGSVASANATIGEAISVVKDEWKRMAEDGITELELEKAKKYLTGSYALRFDGNAKIARMMAGMQLDGFVPEYINVRNERINAVTIEDIARVARTHMQPDDLRFLIVGRPESVSSTN
ncbi:MAG: pitrilysin family protein [Amylibacter sp.]|nr:pitrilysin family protein [Amylibacter sp.]MDG1999879.1 pitrilysin family protein [Amylibacter sp.]